MILNEPEKGSFKVPSDIIFTLQPQPLPLQATPFIDTRQGKINELASKEKEGSTILNTPECFFYLSFLNEEKSGK